ncbi:MAG: hypothetical protein GY750_05230 [Lentisphaerae bacterium]|nr:hypothetical protein [Lentisphaerota bacterium]MCP4100816.1 hypothetical protein [Lentisphaerota bacterium]
MAAVATSKHSRKFSLGSLGNAQWQHHIVYSSFDRHSGRQNYVFADGHCAPHRLSETLAPRDFKWGKKAYSAVGMPDITNPVK